MAALATAAISRVGTETSRAQAQITVTMTATVRPSASLAQAPSATATKADSSIQVTADATPANRVAVPLAARTSTASRTTVAPPFAIAPATTAPPAVVTVPNIGVLLPPAQTPTPSATTTKPTPPKWTRPPTPTAPTTSRNTYEASAALSELDWTHRQGGIKAGCRGDKLVYASPWAATRYEVTTSSTWIRTAICFRGATPVTVLVTCHDGRPTFSTSS